MNKYFIIGYYGNGNFGDEVMLEALQEKLNFDSKFIVTSGDYSIKHKNTIYFPLHSILSKTELSKIFRFKLVFAEIKKIISSVDAVYIGGGTLIKNNFSTNVIFLSISILCKFYDKKLNFISIGIEKLTLTNKIISKIYFALADTIEVRDKFSISKIKNSSFIQDLAIEKFNKVNFSKKEKRLIIAPALFPNDNLLIKAKQYIDVLKNIDNLVLVSSQNLSHNSDLQLCIEIQKKLNCELYKFIDTKSLETFYYYGDIISERYHIGILSCFLDSKLILIGDSKKLKTLSKELKVNIYPNISNIEFNFKKPQIKGIIK